MNLQYLCLKISFLFSHEKNRVPRERKNMENITHWTACFNISKLETKIDETQLQKVLFVYIVSTYMHKDNTHFFATEEYAMNPFLSLFRNSN